MILAACATPTVHDTSALDGRWRNTGGTFHLSNGSTMGPIRSISECVSNRGSDRIVSTYRLVAPGVLETHVIENKSFPQVIGARSRIEFRIDNGTLFTTAYPAAPTAPTGPYPVKVDATWVRE